MRAISPHGRYSIPLTRGKVVRGVDKTGTLQEYEEGETTIANFEMAGGLTDKEQAVVLASFNFSGVPEGVNPLSTVGTYDTEARRVLEGWSDDYHDQVCQRLRELAALDNVHFIIVDADLAVKPWPTYDEDSIEEILAFAERLDLAEAVRVYESENKNRAQIIAALADAEPVEAEEAITVGA
jgi:hypothetical protein